MKKKHSGYRYIIQFKLDDEDLFWSTNNLTSALGVFKSFAKINYIRDLSLSKKKRYKLL